MRTDSPATRLVDSNQMIHEVHAFFDVTLGQILFLAQDSQTFTDNHRCSAPERIQVLNSSVLRPDVIMENRSPASSL